MIADDDGVRHNPVPARLESEIELMQEFRYKQFASSCDFKLSL